MKMYLCHPSMAVVLTLVPLAVWAATARGPATLHPDYPSQCWLAGPSLPLSPGQTHTLAPCTRTTCFNDTRSNALYVEYATCPLVAVPPGCMTIKKDGAPYPECCPQGICPSSVGRDFTSPEYDEFTDWLSQNYDYEIV